MKMITDRDAWLLARANDTEVHDACHVAGEISLLFRNGYLVADRSRGLVPSEKGRIALRCWELVTSENGVW